MKIKPVALSIVREGNCGDSYCRDHKVPKGKSAMYQHRTVYTAGQEQRAKIAGTVKKWVPPVPTTVSSDWYSDPSNPMGAFDAFLHVAAWIVAIVFDHLLFDKADGWSKIVPPATAPADAYTKPYAMAALVCSWIAFGTIVGMLIIHRFMTPIYRQVDSAVLAIITAGVRASMVFTLIITLFTVGVTADRGEDWRNFSIIAIIVKLYINHVLDHNNRKTGSQVGESANITNRAADVPLAVA